MFLTTRVVLAPPHCLQVLRTQELLERKPDAPCGPAHSHSQGEQHISAGAWGGAAAPLLSAGPK